MAIRNIREARQCLKAHGVPFKGSANVPKTRTRSLTERQRNLLVDMGQGFDGPVYQLRETLGGDIFDAVTLDASHNELQKMYGSVPDDWRSIAKVRTTPDFKTINSARLGGLSNLDTVPENAGYKLKEQTDEKVSYTPTKKGNLLSISLEASYGDAIGAFKEEVGLLGKAAKNTLNEFVLGSLFDDNPTCDYDTTALFDAAHSNYDTGAALSHDNLQAGIAAIMNQTGVAGEQIYLRPTFLAVNPARMVLANELIKSATQESGAAAIPTMSYIPKVLMPTVMASPHLNADSKDWYLMTDHPVVEVSFVRGQTEPEIIQEPESTGRSFTTDSITWKVRHSYGGDVIDHRGAYHGEE